MRLHRSSFILLYNEVLRVSSWLRILLFTFSFSFWSLDWKNWTEFILLLNFSLYQYHLLFILYRKCHFFSSRAHVDFNFHRYNSLYIRTGLLTPEFWGFFWSYWFLIWCIEILVHLGYLCTSDFSQVDYSYLWKKHIDKSSLVLLGLFIEADDYKFVWEHEDWLYCSLFGSRQVPKVLGSFLMIVSGHIQTPGNWRGK